MFSVLLRGPVHSECRMCYFSLSPLFQNDLKPRGHFLEMGHRRCPSEPSHLNNNRKQAQMKAVQRNDMERGIKVDWQQMVVKKWKGWLRETRRRQEKVWIQRSLRGKRMSEQNPVGRSAALTAKTQSWLEGQHFKTAVHKQWRWDQICAETRSRC